MRTPFKCPYNDHSCLYVDTCGMSVDKSCKECYYANNEVRATGSMPGVGKVFCKCELTVNKCKKAHSITSPIEPMTEKSAAALQSSFNRMLDSALVLLKCSTDDDGSKKPDADKERLTEIPKHKEPKVGELAIFWSKSKDKAIIGKLHAVKHGWYYVSDMLSYSNAILFESIDKYETFKKTV